MENYSSRINGYIKIESPSGEVTTFITEIIEKMLPDYGIRKLSMVSSYNCTEMKFTDIPFTNKSAEDQMFKIMFSIFEYMYVHPKAENLQSIYWTIYFEFQEAVFASFGSKLNVIQNTHYYAEHFVNDEFEGTRRKMHHTKNVYQYNVTNLMSIMHYTVEDALEYLLDEINSEGYINTSLFDMNSIPKRIVLRRKIFRINFLNCINW